MQDKEADVHGRGRDRRTEERKRTSLPVSIGEAPFTGSAEPVTALEDFFPARNQLRKKPDHEMKVALFFQAIDEGTILNLSKQGLAIYTKTCFFPGKKIAVNFLIPDDLSNEQIPVFAKCLVMWSRGDVKGYQSGLQIVLMDSEDARALSVYVDRLSVIADEAH
jgi:hypothetical protein